MKRVGITGGMGMGKSTSAALLAEMGIRVVDTDQLARDVVEPGQPALKEVVREFGPGVLASDGTLNRKALAEQVFQDAGKLKTLESILHPRIRESWKQCVQQWNSEGAEIGAVVIPLLFETAAQSEFETIICVACTSGTQRERLHQRGLSNTEIARRLQAQWPVQRKMDLSNFVVWTEGTPEVHREQLSRILKP